MTKEEFLADLSVGELTQLIAGMFYGDSFEKDAANECGVTLGDAYTELGVRLSKSAFNSPYIVKDR